MHFGCLLHQGAQLQIGIGCHVGADASLFGREGMKHMSRSTQCTTAAAGGGGCGGWWTAATAVLVYHSIRS